MKSVKRLIAAGLLLGLAVGAFSAPEEWLGDWRGEGKLKVYHYDTGAVTRDKQRVAFAFGSDDTVTWATEDGVQGVAEVTFGAKDVFVGGSESSAHVRLVGSKMAATFTYLVGSKGLVTGKVRLKPPGGTTR